MLSPRRYRAFISYSHADERWARWLQRALERYRVPGRLRALHPALPLRLYPVFRDRAELASATDLSDSIQRAMADSDALVVVCSPAAAASRWVNAEIRRFQADGRGPRIFCLLVAGRPDAEAADCAFPPALLRDEDGRPLPEPLAADLTPGGDGQHSALLKLAAGLLGVGIDEIKRRDAQRQARVWSAVAAGSLAVAALTIGLAVLALLARQDAELRRQQAENLIGFMLGDLRGKLQPIGKLDLLDAVGDQAMNYFAAIGERGSANDVLARAKALRQIGEVRFNQGHLEPALEAFRQSLDQARTLYERAPENNDYLFELGQAEFWVGYVAWQRNDLESAAAAMQGYMQHSRELLGRDPDNVGYQMELAYAYINLGGVARERGVPAEALGHFKESEAIWRRLAAADTDNSEYAFMVAETLSWDGSTLLDLGRLRESEQVFREAYTILAKLHQTGTDTRFSHKFGDVGIFLGQISLHLGNLTDAAQLFETSHQVNQDLVNHDPSNAAWRRVLYDGQRFQAEMALATGQPELAGQFLASAEAGLRQLVQEDPSDSEYATNLAMTERFEAERLLDLGRVEEAVVAAKQAQARIDGVRTTGSRATAKVDAALVAESLGHVQAAAGRIDLAEASLVDAQGRLDAGTETGIVSTALRARLACHFNRIQEARELASHLRTAGFADPRFQIPCADLP